MSEAESSNFQLFRDCLSTPLIARSSTGSSKKPRRLRGGKKSVRARTSCPVKEEEPNDAEELAEFIDYLAQEIFANLPADVRTLTFSTWLNTPALQVLYTDPLPLSTSSKILDALPPTITDSLTTYALLPALKTTTEFLTPVLSTYISILITPPPAPSQLRSLATECEICQRSWIPLSYHHLIPRGVHAKVLKRGWHTQDQLQNVAWLCRGCHSFVHRIASNEELAREWYSVEKLLEREDVQRFGEWIGKIRWKSK